MLFKKYRSLENSYRTAFIAQIRKEEQDQGEFIVEEKVHGANFSIITDGVTVQAAKRNSALSETDSFYNFKKVLDKYRENAKKVFDLVKQENDAVNQIQIFGELYGGHYPHPEVEPVQGVSKVAKGVYYNPDQDFYAFDVRVDTAEDERYLDVDSRNTVLDATGFFCAEVLFRGTFDEALAYKNEYESTLPARLGLPAVENNLCEGNVIKPVTDRYLAWGPTRVIIKNKNEKWSENKGSKEVKVAKELSAELKAALEKAAPFITETRMMNVLSHFGAFSMKDFGKILGVYTKDIIVDFNKEHEGVIDGLEKSDQKAFNKQLSKLIVPELRTFVMENEKL